MRPLVFHGTESEAQDLAVAVEHNCGCARLQRQAGIDATGMCSAHTLLLGGCRTDQRALDGLIYVRRTLRARLLEREFGVEPTPAQPPANEPSTAR